MSQSPTDGHSKRDQRVAAHYAALPYPERNPADENKRLITGSPSHLSEIEHYLRKGRRAGDLRALIAGGGTGDAAIMLAQQLQDRGEGGHVDYLDMSEASMKIARRRAKVRGLKNISFKLGSLLELASLYDKPFDYIDCCGVLHHLEDPVAGLAALTSVLAPGGGMGLMLYGEYGRTGVYHMQSALRRLAGPDADIGKQLATARKTLANLPASNWLKRNPFVGDHLATVTGAGDDAGLYDLLLHARDRAYTVPQVAALLQSSGLEVIAFIEPKQYDPGIYLADEDLKVRAQSLPFIEQAALAEELSGAQKIHTFYCTRQDDPAAGVTDITDLTLQPVLREHAARDLAAGLRRMPRLKVNFDGTEVTTTLTGEEIDILELMDGKRTGEDIKADLDLTEEVMRRRYQTLTAALCPLNILLFRQSSLD